MNKKDKTGNSTFSSMIDLKAELLRKQKTLQEEKSLGRKISKPQEKRDFWSKGNSGVRERAQRDLEDKAEEEDSLEKSRKVLELKAKAYDAMVSGTSVSEEDGGKRFLVDFEKKTIDKLLKDKQQREETQKREQQRQREEEEAQRQRDTDLDKKHMSEDLPSPDDPKEEWVDYTDGLGRSRRCMKKDVPILKEMDKNLVPSSSQGDQEETGPDLMSHDMYREKLRQQWEKEQQEAIDGPLHYANVQYNEIRTHGVGFYQFGKEEEARQEQLTNLNQLREQTKAQRTSQQRLKDKRKAMMAARLLKVRQRKLIREGKDPSELLDQQPEDDDSDEEDVIGPKLSEKLESEVEPLTRDDSWRRDAPVRDWDKGKDDLKDFLKGKPQMTEGAWLEKVREERQEDFAPPSFYDWEVAGKQDGRTLGTLGTSFKTGVKKQPKTDPMALLEQVTGEAAVDVTVTLSKLRKESETVAMSKSSTGNQVGVADIPLPSLDSSTQNQPASSNTTAADEQSRSSHGINSSTANSQGQNYSEGQTFESYANPMTQYYGYQSYAPAMPVWNTAPPQVSNQFQYVPPETIPTQATTQPPDLSYTSQIYSQTGSLPPGTIPTQATIQPPDLSYTSQIYSQTQSIPPGTIPTQTTVQPPALSYTSQIYSQTQSIPPGTIPTQATIQPPDPAYSSQIMYSQTRSHQATADPISTSTHSEPSHSEPSHSEPSEPQCPDVIKPPEAVLAGPQPAHFSAAPMKPQVKKARYQRVLLHELPMSLPVPPTATRAPEYPSQEDVYGSCHQKDSSIRKPLSEEAAIRMWQKQFQGKGGHANLKPDKIPFASPFIQNVDKGGDSQGQDPGLDFDPSKPPPKV